MSNAMDVSQPNNWPRIEALIEHGYVEASILEGDCVDEEYTQVAMRICAQKGYMASLMQPLHTSHCCRLSEDEVGVFLGTAHPAKFRETVENVLGQPISLPTVLADAAAQPCLSIEVSGDYSELKQHLLAKFGDQ